MNALACGTAGSFRLRSRDPRYTSGSSVLCCPAARSAAGYTARCRRGGRRCTRAVTCCLACGTLLSREPKVFVMFWHVLVLCLVVSRSCRSGSFGCIGPVFFYMRYGWLMLAFYVGLCWLTLAYVGLRWLSLAYVVLHCFPRPEAVLPTRRWYLARRRYGAAQERCRCKHRRMQSQWRRQQAMIIQGWAVFVGELGCCGYALYAEHIREAPRSRS